MEFDEPCLEWVPYMPGTTVQEYPVWARTYRYFRTRTK